MYTHSYFNWRHCKEALAEASIPVTALSMTGKLRNADSDIFKAGHFFLQGFGVIVGSATLV